jgi:HEPN domain-containing protein
MDRRELSTPLGFFNFAGSYRAAADKLRVCKLRATHPHSPMLFVYYHSIELYLKAFLRADGQSVAALHKIGHDFKTLQRMCVERGLNFDSEIQDVLAIVAASGAWGGTRYLEVGFHHRPLISVLSRACRKIDRMVGAALSDKGIHIRPIRRGVRPSD